MPKLINAMIRIRISMQVDAWLGTRTDNNFMLSQMEEIDAPLLKKYWGTKYPVLEANIDFERSLFKATFYINFKLC